MYGYTAGYIPRPLVPPITNCYIYLDYGKEEGDEKVSVRAVLDSVMRRQVKAWSSIGFDSSFRGECEAVLGLISCAINYEIDPPERQLLPDEDLAQLKKYYSIDIIYDQKGCNFDFGFG